MSFLLKSAIVILVVAVGGGFLINQVPSWKQKVIEVVNPSAKQARLLGELKTILDELDKSLGSSGSEADAKNGELVSKSKKIVDEIATANQKNSGIIKQQVGKIIDVFLDKTPYPADHLKISPAPSPLVCPPLD